MAKLDIEEIFFLEVMSVAVKVGDEDKAIGNAVRWFRFAQEKHKKGKIVSEDEFKENGFSEALFPKFAKRVEGGGGIVCTGAGKHFSWLMSKSEAGAAGGQASADARRNKNGTAVPQNASNAAAAEAPPKQTEAPPKQTEAPPKQTEAPPKQTEAPPKQTEAPEPSPSYSPSYSPSGSSSVCEGTRTRNVRFETWEDLKQAVPLHYQQDWLKKCKTQSRLDENYRSAFLFHTADPVQTPRTAGQWMRKLCTWFEIERKKPEAKDSLDSLDLSDPLHQEGA
jgi:hypothetical protein